MRLVQLKMRLLSRMREVSTAGENSGPEYRVSRQACMVCVAVAD